MTGNATDNKGDKSGEFIANLLKNLMQNGFPEKKVALPLEKLYESAHSKNVNFNKVLTFLLEEKDIDHEKTSTKIIFFPKLAVVSESENSQAGESASGVMPGLENLDDIMKIGQEMFGNALNPDMLKDGNMNMASLAEKAKAMMASMSPEQLQNLQKIVNNIPSDKKEALMKKAKDLGIK
jgi:hypothetical protein